MRHRSGLFADCYKKVTQSAEVKLCRLKESGPFSSAKNKLDPVDAAKTINAF